MNDEISNIIDFLDLINYTLSSKFVNTWKYKFSEKFLKTFQINILKSLKTQKPLKLNTLTLILKKNNKYSDEQIKNFYESIDINLYRPLIQGK
jgi:hypothetical protein